jgi:hypothetical protein
MTHVLCSRHNSSNAIVATIATACAHVRATGEHA